MIANLRLRLQDGELYAHEWRNQNKRSNRREYDELVFEASDGGSLLTIELEAGDLLKLAQTIETILTLDGIKEGG